MRQADLFSGGRTARPIPQTPDPDQIRVRLHSVLTELRSAAEMPWSPAQLRSWRHVFPNMTNWLPPEERERLRDQFQAELVRLGQN